jgi:hypothetical protein
MTMECPDGTATIENTFNAARTEYNGTVSMKSKRGDMTMTMQGRKIGTCDAQVAQKERQDSAAKKQAEIMGASAALNKQMEQNRQQAFAKLKGECTEAVTTMDSRKFAAPLCLGKETANLNHCMAQNAQDEKMRQGFQQFALPAQDKAFCEAKKKEFCTSLQTEAGFTQAVKTERVTAIDDEGKRNKVTAAQRIPASSAFCTVKGESVAGSLCSKAVEGPSWKFMSDYCPAEAKSAAAKLCPKAAETERYDYLGLYCPAEAKPVYAKNCAGRDYTSVYAKDKKKLAMCSQLGVAMAEEAQPKSGTTQAVDAAKQGAAQTLNKIKGLFGK